MADKSILDLGEEVSAMAVIREGTALANTACRRQYSKVFFDVFNANTRKKLVTIPGKYSIYDPSQVLKRKAWECAPE